MLGREKIAALTSKLNLRKIKIRTGQIGVAFPAFNRMRETNGVCDDIQSAAADHFNRLIEKFHSCFLGFEHDTRVLGFTGIRSNLLLKI